MNAQSSTSVALSDAREAFEQVSAHIAEHGIEPEPLSSAHHRFRYEGSTIQLQHDGSALTIALEAPSANMLYFLKEAAALHVAEIDPMAAEGLRWSDQSAPVRQPVNFSELILLRRSRPIPGLTRLTLEADDVGMLADGGLHVKLMLPADRTRAPVWPSVAANGVTKWPKGDDRLHVRYFTLRSVRPEMGEVDIDVVEHPGGLISDWALEAAPGDRIGVMGPGGGQPPEQQEELLLAGDMTALPPIARILESLSLEASGHLVVAFPEGAEPASYLPPTTLELRTIAPGRFRQEVLPVIQKIGTGHRIQNAWFGGEHANAQALRQLFKRDFGLGQGAQLSVAYWREGRRGDARRETD